MTTQSSRQILRTFMLLAAAALCAGSSARAQSAAAVTVGSSDARELTLTVTPSFTTTTLPGGELIPMVKGGIVINGGRPGEPMRMELSIPVALPGASGNTLEIVSLEYDQPIGGRIAPVPTIDFDENRLQSPRYVVDPAAYARASAQPAAELRYAGIARDVYAGTIAVTPYQYDASSNTIRPLKSVTVRLRYGAAGAPTIGGGEPSDLTRNAFINAASAGGWRIAPSGRGPVFTRPSAVASARAWMRVEVKEDGFYALTAEDFQSAGIDLNSVDPSRIAIYGGDGRALPEPVRYVDSSTMHRIPAIVEQHDGKASRVLFYGSGPSGWEWRFNDTVPIHKINPYVKSNSYIVAVDGEPGLAFPQQPAYGPATVFPTWGITRLFNDEDEVNAIDVDRNGSGSGRGWFGRKLEVDATRPTDTWVAAMSLPGLERSAPITYRVRVAHTGHGAVGSPIAVGNFSFFQQETKLGEDVIPSVGGSESARTTMNKYTMPDASAIGGDDRSMLKIVYSSKVQAVGFLDYYEIHYGRRLVADNNRITFDAPSGGGVAEFRVTGFSTDNLVGYDITDPANPIELRPSGTSGGAYVFSDQLRAPSQTRRYFITDRGQVKRVAAVTKPAFADLRGRKLDADILVITAEDFRQAADKYAAYRNGQARYSTSVVSVDEIYTEFGHGNADPTAIRDFIGHAVRNWNRRPTYVIFFGDGSYDYRNIATEQKQFVPPYETADSVETLDEVSSSSYDDYYARVVGEDFLVDVATGRFPVNKMEDAELIVEKIKQYESSRNFGSWRNTVIYTADDAYPSNAGTDFVRQSEDLWRYSTPKWIEPIKIYLPAYPTEQVGQRRKPGATQDLLQSIERGAVITNWIGHGNPKLWAHELLLEKDQFIPRLGNDSILTYVTAATCNFGYFDEPTIFSGAEMFLLQPKGGAIAVMSASRASYILPNEELISTMYDSLFSHDPTTGRFRSIGSVLAIIKNTNSREWENNQKYHIFGDPSMTLALPVDNVAIDSVNTTDVSGGQVATVKSLSLVSIKGAIRDYAGNIRNDFNGTAIVTLYDASRKMSVMDENIPQAMQFAGGRLFRGPAQVVNGHFVSTFRIPKDIAYDSANGRIHVYAYNDREDAAGATANVRVYGTETLEITDNSGPTIKLFMDDRTFASGDIVSPVPMLIVDLHDTSGINSSGAGLGHRIEAWIDGDPKSIDLTEFYTTLPTDYRTGVAERLLSEMEPGDHTVRVRAWDIFNNSAETSALFRIAEGEPEDLVVANVVNYPNPMGRSTDFTFRHNQTRPLDVEIAVFTLSGRKVKVLESPAVTDRFVRIPWDGTDDDGGTLANGVYLYRLRVKIVGDEKEQEFESIERIAITR